jgi:predicted amidohydrolase
MNSYSLKFDGGSVLPDGWTFNGFNRVNVPQFLLKQYVDGPYLSISGKGDPLAVAYISTNIKLNPGTYTYKARFSRTDDVNPQRNLLIQCRSTDYDGIFKFYRLENGMVEGRDTIVVTGERPTDSELRIYYRFNSGGEVKLRELSLTPSEPVKPQWVRFACTRGRMNMEEMADVAAQAASDKADLLLYPEAVSQDKVAGGECLTELLGELSAKYGMYTAASIYLTDTKDKRNYNRGLLYDRQGKCAGIYDKIHPYSPEVTHQDITPGQKTDVFKTDFGTVGMIICYDSWFTDITALMALKGADVILFPVAGYYRSLIPARAADNQVRFVISVLGLPQDYDNYGIFDTAGRDVEDPNKDYTVRVKKGAETFKDVRTFSIGRHIGMLCASLDLNRRISPHYNGGKMMEAPGGKRNRDDQVLYLDDLIRKEKERWWENEK